MGLTNSKGNTVTICKEISAFSICMVSLCWFSMLILLSFLWIGISHSIQLKNNKILTLYRFTCIQLFIAGTMFPIHFLFQFPFSGYCDNFTRIAFTASISLIAYYLSLICIYSLYLLRLQSLSRHSSNKSRITLFIDQFMKFGVFAQIVLVILVVWWDIEVYYSLYVMDRKSYLFWWSLLVPTYLSFGIVNVCFNLILLLLFLHRIHVFQISQSNIASIMEPVSVYTSSFIFVFLTTLTQTVYGALRGHLYINSNNVYMFQLLLINVDILTNCIALNVQFEPMQQILRNKYEGCYQMCCLCWAKKVSKQIQLNIMKQLKVGNAATNSNKESGDIVDTKPICNTTTNASWPQDSVKPTPHSTVTVTHTHIKDNEDNEDNEDSAEEFDSQRTTTSDLARGEFKKKYNIPPDDA